MSTCQFCLHNCHVAITVFDRTVVLAQSSNKINQTWYQLLTTRITNNSSNEVLSNVTFWFSLTVHATFFDFFVTSGFEYIALAFVAWGVCLFVSTTTEKQQKTEWIQPTFSLSCNVCLTDGLKELEWNSSSSFSVSRGIAVIGRLKPGFFCVEWLRVWQQWGGSHL